MIKDHLHTDIILEKFGLTIESYPHHFIPSSTAFVEAIEFGFRFGMVPDYQIGQRLHTGEWLETMPIDSPINIELYWHHWKQQSPPLAQLTRDMIDKAPFQQNQQMNTSF